MSDDLAPRILLSTPTVRAVLVRDRIRQTDKIRSQVFIERLDKDSMGKDRWMERTRHTDSDGMLDLLMNGVRDGVPLPVLSAPVKDEPDENGRKKFTLELTEDELAILRYVISRVGNDDSDPLKDTYEMEKEPEDKYAVLDEVHDKVMMLRWEEKCR